MRTPFHLALAVVLLMPLIGWLFDLPRTDVQFGILVALVVAYGEVGRARVSRQEGDE
jgi:hypothetical protein